MTTIHPSACVDPKARVGQDVEIGPNCFVGPHVVLGDGCRLHNNVTITGRTRVGAGNQFYPQAVIGADPQDLKYEGEPTELVVGDDNVFRELVTAHTGTAGGGGVTRIGHHNRFLIGVHIAHDVTIQDHVVLANSVQVGGHVLLESYVNVGGMTGFHHFVRVGRHAMVAGMTRANVDVPPYMIAHGAECRVRGVNVNGMARWGFSQERLAAIRQAFKDIYSERSRFSGPILRRLEGVESNGELTDDVKYLIRFVRDTLQSGHRGRFLESARDESTRKRAAFYEEVTEKGAEV